MISFIKFILSLFSPKKIKKDGTIALDLVKEQPMKYEPTHLFNLITTSEDLKPSETKNNNFKMTKELITPENIKKIFQQKNYVLFENDVKNYNVNIFGIRTADMIPNTFNDFVCLMWKYQGNWITKIYTATTDPGTYYLEHPMNAGGTFILCPGQYRSSHQIGTHINYTALVQRGMLRGYRDNDKDNVFDLDPKTITEGNNYGVNIHHAGTWSTQVDNWSAGCQVLAHMVDWTEFLGIVEESKNIYGNSFTYTLINEDDFKDIINVSQTIV